MQANNAVTPLAIKHFREDLALLARFIYKTKNQQRRMAPFKHLQGVKRFGNKLITASTEAEAKELIARTRSEIAKCGENTLWHTRKSFFLGGSVVVTGILARLDLCLS